MPDENTTAQATEDSAETPQENLDSAEHQEEVEETAEETAENNEASSEDSDGAPEEKDEEEDPLLKAKKHADRKITELGQTVTAKEQALIAAVRKSPELLIEMYDEKSELYDRTLAEKIKAAHPDVYNRADEIYRGAPKAQAAPDIDQLVSKKVEEYLNGSSEKQVLDNFRKELGYDEQQFSLIEGSILNIAKAICRENLEMPLEVAIKNAFIGMYPGEYTKTVKKEIALGASKKRAMVGPSGGGSSDDGTSKMKLTAEDKEAIRVSGLSEERYIELMLKKT